MPIHPGAHIGRVAQLGSGNRLPALKAGSEDSAFKGAPGDFGERVAAAHRGTIVPGRIVDEIDAVIFSVPAGGFFHASI